MLYRPSCWETSSFVASGAHHPEEASVLLLPCDGGPPGVPAGIPLKFTGTAGPYPLPPSLQAARRLDLLALTFAAGQEGGRHGRADRGAGYLGAQLGLGSELQRGRPPRSRPRTILAPRFG